MKISQAINSYQEYHRLNSKKNTQRNYDFLFIHFKDHLGNREIDSITPYEEVLLRHSNISTTQRYLGKISDVEAVRWIDNLHG